MVIIQVILYVAIVTVSVHRAVNAGHEMPEISPEIVNIVDAPRQRGVFL